MIEAANQPSDILPCGLCEDGTGEAMTLVERVAMRDREALSKLHALWSPPFLGIAFRILGDRKSADLAVHRTFLQLWKRSATFNPHVSPPLVWGASLLRDECLRLLPKCKPGEETPHTTGVLPSSQTRAISADDRHRLESALEHLTPKEHAILEQAVFLGFARKHPAAAPADSTTKTTLRSALDKLRSQLSLHEL